jgi:peptidoglycan/LPS O-acetylase OafA/YrhL
MSTRPSREVRVSTPLLPGLHGLRALAATTVVLFHLHHITGLPLPPALSFVGTHFGLGVQLFFVLSTFSLFYSTTHTVSQEGWADRYVIRRFFRVAPLFYFMLAVWSLLFISRGVDIHFSEVFLNLLLAFNFVPGKHESIVQAGWTVGVEVIMYALLPLLLLTIRHVGQALLYSFFAIAVSLLVSEQLNLSGGVLKSYSYFSFASSLGSFSLGILAFKVYEVAKLGGDRRRRRIRNSGVVLTLVLFGVLTVPNVFFDLLVNPMAVATVWCILFATLICVQALAPGSLLSSRAFVFLGERSYGIYLTHPLVLFLLGPLNLWMYSYFQGQIGAWGFVPCGVLTLAVVICASMAVYKLIERPGMRLGQFIISRSGA